MENDFKVVKRKGRKPKVDRGRNFCGAEFIVDYVDVDLNAFLAKIKKTNNNFKISNYFTKLISAIETADVEIDCLLCYGLGSLSDSYISRHQFAALVALKNHFNCLTSAYDPIFNPIDVDVLKKFNIEVLDKNDEGKRPISSSQKTLVYFAHCSSQLVNNFLWANWSPVLFNCVILSNSFSSVIHRNDVPYLNCIRDVTTLANECVVPNLYEVADVFNDLSVHSFSADKLSDSAFWSHRPEPDYSNYPIEICTKDVTIKVRKLEK